MFNTRLPDGGAHPKMLEKAQHAFSLLQERLATMQLRDPDHEIENPVKHNALFIWSALHGLASLMQPDALTTVGLDAEEKALAVERLMRRLGLALEA